MNVKPKRRWYQFSLKALLVLLTVLSVGLGRFAYLRERAERHEAAAQQIGGELSAACNESPGYAHRKIAFLSHEGFVTVVVGPREWIYVDGDYIPVGLQYPPLELWLTAYEETQLGAAYRRALYRPWATVEDVPEMRLSYRRDSRIWD